MRTTIADVRAILDATTLTDPVITAFITSANIFVTNSLGTSTLDAATLADIERWVAAHFITSTLERQTSKESAGSASVTYAGNFDGMGLLLTSYGQMACALDTTGTLTELAKQKQRAFIYVPGVDE